MGLVETETFNLFCHTHIPCLRCHIASLSIGLSLAFDLWVILKAFVFSNINVNWQISIVFTLLCYNSHNSMLYLVYSVLLPISSLHIQYSLIVWCTSFFYINALCESLVFSASPFDPTTSRSNMILTKFCRMTNIIFFTKPLDQSVPAMFLDTINGWVLDYISELVVPVANCTAVNCHTVSSDSIQILQEWWNFNFRSTDATACPVFTLPYVTNVISKVDMGPKL